MVCDVEIVGWSGKVHYRRPATHPMVGEALARLDYSVRLPAGATLADLEVMPHDYGAEVSIGDDWSLTVSHSRKDCGKPEATEKPCHK